MTRTRHSTGRVTGSKSTNRSRAAPGPLHVAWIKVTQQGLELTEGGQGSLSLGTADVHRPRRTERRITRWLGNLQQS
jgi:hypothetical protein